MRECTYDEFDALCMEFEDKQSALPERDDYSFFFPTEEDMERINADPDKYYDFVIYLTVINPLPRNEEEKLSMKRLDDFIKANTHYTDSLD